MRIVLRSLLLLFFLSVVMNAQTTGSLLIYDDFTGYAVDTLDGQNGWTKYGSGPDVLVSNTTPLFYEGYNYGDGEYLNFPVNASSSSRVFKNFTDTTYSLITPGTVLYYSLLLRIDDAFATYNYFFSLGQIETTNYYARMHAQEVSETTFKLGISKTSNTARFSDKVLNYGETYVVIVRYDVHNTATGQNNNIAYMWINPEGTVEPDTATADAKVWPGQPDYNAVHCSAVMWHNRGLGNALGSIDGIRVAGAKEFKSIEAWEMLDPGPLPVELTSFTYFISNGKVVLNWKTATEVNNKGFEVERKGINEKSWASLGFVPGYGTSTTSRSYTYTDNSVKSGKYNYRLKQIDNNGAYQYIGSVMTEMSAPDNFSLSQNYPNPFNPSTKIDYQLPSESKVKIELYSITGQKLGDLVNADQSAGFHSVTINANNFKGISSGMYIYKMTAVDKATGSLFVNTRKMTLMK